MGVYINMEMPKDEAVALYIYPDGRAKLWRPQAAVSHEFEAIPVPPNGRLIDAEKLIAELKNPPLHRSLAGMCMDDVVGMINDAPTVIPAEEEKS